MYLIFMLIICAAYLKWLSLVHQLLPCCQLNRATSCLLHPNILRGTNPSKKNKNNDIHNAINLENILKLFSLLKDPSWPQAWVHVTCSHTYTDWCRKAILLLINIKCRIFMHLHICLQDSQTVSKFTSCVLSSSTAMTIYHHKSRLQLP